MNKRRTVDNLQTKLVFLACLVPANNLIIGNNLDSVGEKEYVKGLIALITDVHRRMDIPYDVRTR